MSAAPGPPRHSCRSQHLGNKEQYTLSVPGAHDSNTSNTRATASSLARQEGQLKGSDSTQGLCLATGQEEGLPGRPGAVLTLPWGHCFGDFCP